MLCLSSVLSFIILYVVQYDSAYSLSPLYCQSHPTLQCVTFPSDSEPPLSCGNTMENHAGPQTSLHLTASVKQTLKDRESGGEKRGLVSQKTFQLNHVGDWKLFRLLLKVNFTQSWTHSWQWSWPRQPVSTWGSPSCWSPGQWWSGLRMFQSTDFANSGKHNFIFVPDGNNLC